MANLLRSFSRRFRRHPSSYSKGMFFDSKKTTQCKVLLLDGTDLAIIVSRKAIGQDVYDQVYYSLDLEERDYFGLQFMDTYHVQHWLDPVKKLTKQVPIGPPYTFRFRVKFYSSEPNNLHEELTRYQFFLQLKQDLQSGRLPCQREIAIELASLALQSELGDFNSQIHSPAYISEFRFHPEQDEQMELEILDKFQLNGGQSPATAELAYLNRAKWLDMYGVDMHIVQGKDGNQYSLGLTPTGMLVFDGEQKIGLFFWPKIQKLCFKKKKLILVVEEDDDQNGGHIHLHTFVFNLSSHKACKHLWKCAIEYHSFFRLTVHGRTRSTQRQFFRLGSTFKYRGRTEYENVHKDGGGRLSRRNSCDFERRPSQRFGPRPSHLIRQKRRSELRNKVAIGIGMDVDDAANSNTDHHNDRTSSPLIIRPSPIGSSNNSAISGSKMGPNSISVPLKPVAAQAKFDDLIFSPRNDTNNNNNNNGDTSTVEDKCRSLATNSSCYNQSEGSLITKIIIEDNDINMQTSNENENEITLSINNCSKSKIPKFVAIPIIPNDTQLKMEVNSTKCLPQNGVTQSKLPLLNTNFRMDSEFEENPDALSASSAVSEVIFGIFDVNYASFLFNKPIRSRIPIFDSTNAKNEPNVRVNERSSSAMSGIPVFHNRKTSSTNSNSKVITEL